MHLYQSNINYSKKLIFHIRCLYRISKYNDERISRKSEIQERSHNFGVKKKAVWKPYNTWCSVNARAFSQVSSGSL